MTTFKQRIGLLRQYLNERTKKGLITNEELSAFLIPEEEQNAQDFADTLKYDPGRIIEWCREEIAAYKQLIKILEDRKP